MRSVHWPFGGGSFIAGFPPPKGEGSGQSLLCPPKREEEGQGTEWGKQSARREEKGLPYPASHLGSGAASLGQQGVISAALPRGGEGGDVDATDRRPGHSSSLLSLPGRRKPRPSTRSSLRSTNSAWTS